MNLDIAQFEEEIGRLEQMVEKFKAHGMTDKVLDYQIEIDNLRLRLDRLKTIEFWEADDEHN